LAHIDFYVVNLFEAVRLALKQRATKAETTFEFIIEKAAHEHQWAFEDLLKENGITPLRFSTMEETRISHSLCRDIE
jgi:hypothetical protein